MLTKREIKIFRNVVFACILLMAAAIVWGTWDSRVRAQQFEPTPHDRIAGEVAAYESFAEGVELTRMLRAYADRQPCLSMQLKDGEHVFYWWCSRFKLVDRVEL
jgi:hypothetical protein